MRLLQLHNHGEVSLTKNFIDPIPPYAILSHTWGADDEEVTFEDLTQGVGKNKAGYEKISFCEKQAARDGLQYVWIDTCCIDKSSSTELSEALNSMFRWYSKAHRCYVYLADVSERDAGRVAFCNSRWFTRGWTLQELLAPSSVEFFEREGKRLGDKNSLCRQVSKITGIPTNALQGEPLSSFSVAVRISWAEKRQTKREEDKAYSLMGMVGVHMPPLYGEGEKEAFERLHSEISRREKLLFHDKNGQVEHISKSSTADCSTGLTRIPLQARTNLGLS
jgi:Heterokaryon incompatibility protein (HET)